MSYTVGSDSCGVTDNRDWKAGSGPRSLDVGHSGDESGAPRSRQIDDGPLRERAIECLARHATWLLKWGAESFDPHDLWATPAGSVAKQFYYRRPWIGWIAAGPFVAVDLLLPDARRLVAPRRRSAIGDAHLALACLKHNQITPDADLRGFAYHRLEDLVRQGSGGLPDIGHPFDWQARTGRICAHTPLITVMPYVYDAFEAGARASGRNEWVTAMRAIARFAHDAIPQSAMGLGRKASAYTPTDHRLVVNASAYRAYLLAKAAQRFSVDRWAIDALESLQYVIDCQGADGSWRYSLDGSDRFVDHLHTCFVLKNLIAAAQYLSLDLRSVVSRAVTYYTSHLLTPDGLPRPFSTTNGQIRGVRMELYDLAEALGLYGLLGRQFPDFVALRSRLARYVIDEWLLPDGRFLSRRSTFGKVTLPFLRWGQSQMYYQMAVFAGGDG